MRSSTTVLFSHFKISLVETLRKESKQIHYCQRGCIHFSKYQIAHKNSIQVHVVLEAMCFNNDEVKFHFKYYGKCSCCFYLYEF